MPTYEFRCPDGTIIERIFKMSDVPDEIPTPDGAGVATRIISGGAGLLFKGSGFYITDYGKDGKKDQRTAAASSAAGESAGATGGESKSADGAKPAAESKPASAPSSSTAAPSSPPTKPE